MPKNLLTIENLYASVEGQELLTGLDLTIHAGEIHALMGPNGAGKSTLANVIMGNPNYEVTKGEIIFEDEDITKAKTDYRAKKGLFLSFQAPEEVEGITVENFLRTAKSNIMGEEVKPLAFHRQLMKTMETLQQDSSYASRYLNVGFSGGEKKKNEILQLLTLNPKLAILDETDSGLDVDAVNIVSNGINHFHTDQNAILIITHNIRMLQQIEPDFVHVLIAGKIVQTGDATLAHEISQNGFTHLQSKE